MARTIYILSTIPICPAFSSLLQVDSPFRLHGIRHDLEARSAIGPFEDFRSSGSFGAEHGWLRADADSAQIQAVRIPAGLNGDVGLGIAFCVTDASFVEKIEFLVGKNKPLVTKSQGELAAPLTVPEIIPFAQTPGIVKDGEQLNNFDVGVGVLSQPKAVFQDPRPVADAVDATPGQGIVFEDSMNEGFEIEHPATTA